MGVVILFMNGVAHPIPMVPDSVCQHGHTVCGSCMETWLIDYTFGGAYDIEMVGDRPVLVFATGE